MSGICFKLFPEQRSGGNLVWGITKTWNGQQNVGTLFQTFAEGGFDGNFVWGIPRPWNGQQNDWNLLQTFPEGGFHGNFLEGILGALRCSTKCLEFVSNFAWTGIWWESPLMIPRPRLPRWLCKKVTYWHLTMFMERMTRHSPEFRQYPSLSGPHNRKGGGWLTTGTENKQGHVIDCLIDWLIDGLMDLLFTETQTEHGHIINGLIDRWNTNRTWTRNWLIVDWLMYWSLKHNTTLEMLLITSYENKTVQFHACAKTLRPVTTAFSYVQFNSV